MPVRNTAPARLRHTPRQGRAHRPGMRTRTAGTVVDDAPLWRPATPNRLRQRTTRRAPILLVELPVTCANAQNTTPPEVIRGRSWASEIGRPISVRIRSSVRQAVLLAAAGKGRRQGTPGATREAWGAAVRDVATGGVHGGGSCWGGRMPEPRARYASVKHHGKPHVHPFVGNSDFACRLVANRSETAAFVLTDRTFVLSHPVDSVACSEE